MKVIVERNSSSKYFCQKENPGFFWKNHVNLDFDLKVMHPPTNQEWHISKPCMCVFGHLKI